ncbi:MAG TPA: sugar nucleotide-binding protein [Bacteriovoracaceae bacterium]|nr:sugar nucleotide-binding protein [Bacteriovoracaceae bacterium]
MKKTILIFGVSSFVGSNLAQMLGDEYRIVGTYNKTPVDIPGVTCVPLDVLKKDNVFKVLSIFKPNFTIYAVGMSSLTECLRNPKKADALNSAGASNCTMASERFGSKFIYLSSCYVLGGADTVYKESDTPFPNTVYGNSLSSTEFYVQRSCLNYLILRCAPLYGRSYNPLHPNWFEMLQTSLAKNVGIPADDEVWTGFLDVYVLAKIVKSMIHFGVTNKLLQVSSNNSMTRFEFAKAYAKVFKKDANLIQPSSGTFPIDRNQGKAVVANLFYKLDVSNLESLLGVKVPSIEESLLLTYQRFNAGV